MLVLAPPAARGTDDDPPLHDLSLEVTALQTLYFLQPTPKQEQTLRELALKTASRSGPRRPGKASAELRATLAGLRRALLAEDDDGIDELGEKLEELREDQEPDIDDEVEVTEEALEEAPKLLRQLSPRQVAVYAAGFADEIPDPLEEITAALDKVRDLDDKKWQQFRAVPEHLGTLLGGTDGDRSSAYRDKILQLFILARSLDDDDFKQRKPDLEKQARAIVGDVGPLEVIRHHLEYQLAELLSNPRLAAALEARAKGLRTREVRK